jgi:outer membrane protein assembly complex protein YaeT
MQTRAFIQRTAAALLIVLGPILARPASSQPTEATSARQERGVSTVRFEGNTSISSADLRKAADRELSAFEGGGGKRADADDAAFQMELAYRKAGYAFAVVNYRITRVADKPTATFIITEGPRVRIGEIRFRGNSAFTSRELDSFFEQRTISLLGRGERFFVRSEIDWALSRIRDFYRGHGYMDMVVGKPQFEFSPDRAQVIITVPIREGRLYVIQEVAFTGDIPPAAAKALQKTRSELMGKPYFSSRKQTLQSRILDIYGNLGYPDARVAVEEKSPGSQGDTTLAAAISSGPLVRISGVAVKGNEHTRTSFIKEHLRLRSGDRYDAAKIRESFGELYKTGLFSMVNLDLVRTSVEDRRILQVTVTESMAKELFVEPGWGSYERLRCKVGFREKNLFGRGIIFGSEIKGSLKDEAANISLTDRSFTGKDITATMPVYYHRRKEPSFTSTEYGVSLLFSKSLTDHLMATGGYGFRFTRLSNVDPSEVSDDYYNLGSVKAQTTYDTRDDLLFPTSGLRSFLSVEHADSALGGNVTFTRLTGGIRHFFRLGKNTVLGARYSTGLILPGSGQVSVPLAERFFNGGENTVRSFKESELGPKDASGNPVGGLAFNVFNIELRQRLVGNFVGTLFFDCGNVAPNRSRQELGKPAYDRRSDIVSDTFSDYFKDFRTGVGFGFQYLLPIGAARLDFAFNPDRDSERGEDSFVVHFSVGMAF